MIEYGALIDLKPEQLESLFYNGIQCQMLINRAIGNTNKGSKRWINKLISYNADSFNSNINQLKEYQDYLNDSDIRLYGSLNYRDLTKGIKQFITTILDTNPIEYPAFFSHIQPKFVSALMKPESKASDNKLWLLDIDYYEKEKEFEPRKLPLALTEETLERILLVNNFIKKVEIVACYNTFKGIHYIVKPFNLNEIKLPDYVTLIRDGLVLLRGIR